MPDDDGGGGNGSTSDASHDDDGNKSQSDHDIAKMMAAMLLTMLVTIQFQNTTKQLDHLPILFSRGPSVPTTLFSQINKPYIFGRSFLSINWHRSRRRQWEWLYDRPVITIFLHKRYRIQNSG